MDRVVYMLAACLCGLAAVGCQQAKSQMPPPPPAEVLVEMPVEKEITDHEDFTGQTEAFKSVEVRARVTGYLEQVNFQDGTEVAEGAVLFNIDARPYQAQVDKTEATVAQNEARLNRLNLDLQRTTVLRSKGVLTQEDFDKVTGDRAEAEATLRAARADLERARLDLEFTRVRAPISGRISRKLLDIGNLIKGDETVLTTINTPDPMYVYFDVNERTLLRLRRMVQSGKMRSSKEVELPVLMGLADEGDDFSHAGIINFEENKLDSSTGTLRIRGIFPNPSRLLSPGLFVRIRVPIGAAYRAVLVSEQSLGTDQGQKFLFVINAQDEAEYRKVQTGGLHDGLRVITDGLKMGEKVVVNGLQRIRPGAKVAPKFAAEPK